MGILGFFILLAGVHSVAALISGPVLKGVYECLTSLHRSECLSSQALPSGLPCLLALVLASVLQMTVCIYKNSAEVETVVKCALSEVHRGQPWLSV